MNKEFWLNKWRIKQIGFHRSQPNPALINYCSLLNLPQNSRIFVPLCGKTLDIAWLLQQGYQVVGIDLSPIAIEELCTCLLYTSPSPRD